MRLGLVLPAGQEAWAAEAEARGLFGVLVGGRRPGEEMVAAVWAAASTKSLRIVVRIALGSETPVTLAEELAVLDNVCGGRLVALLDTGGLGSAEAGERLGMLVSCCSGRPFRSPGGVRELAVTPPPAQVAIPIWLTGPAATELSSRLCLPRLATHPELAEPQAPVQPALDGLQGELAADLARVSSWSKAGATHLLLELPFDPDLATLLDLFARHLAPAAAAPDFPRVIAESPPPLPWPGD